MEELLQKRSMLTEGSTPSPTPQKKQCRKEYNVTNRSCEIVVNGLKEVTKKFERSCKSVINVVKANPRTKFKTHFCLTAIPEFMERVHELDFSNRVIFLDGTGNANRFNCCVFVLMVDSHVGALPFGFFITSLKSASLLEHTFNALADIKPMNAFSKSSSPLVVITGVDQAEYVAVTKCFHSVKAYIGTFQLLRDVWRFIWNPDNNIAATDKPQLYKLFKDIMASRNEEQLDSNIWVCSENPTSTKYPEFVKYFNTLLKRKDFWGLDFRVSKSIPYNKNIFTSEKHVVKETILHNSRAFSVTELFEFFCTQYCDYYISKIIDATSGSFKILEEVRYMPDCWNDLNDFEYRTDEITEEILVISHKKKSEYYVNRELGTCTCVLGRHGTPCVHQFVVAVHFNSKLLTVADMNSEEKAKYRYLATGSLDVLDPDPANVIVDPDTTNIIIDPDTSNVIIDSDPANVIIDSDTSNIIIDSDPSNIIIDSEPVNAIVDSEPTNVIEECVYQNGEEVSEVDTMTEYIVVSHVEDHENYELKREYSTEDCLRAVEMFWSKLAPHTKTHPHEICEWFNSINNELEQANNFENVLNALYQRASS